MRRLWLWWLHSRIRHARDRKRALAIYYRELDRAAGEDRMQGRLRRMRELTASVAQRSRRARELRRRRWER